MIIDNRGHAVRSFDHLRRYLRDHAESMLKANLTDAFTHDDFDEDALAAWDHFAAAWRTKTYAAIDAFIAGLSDSGVLRESARPTYDEQ